MLQQHFSLQYKLINRKLKDFGLEPVLAYIILPVIFILVSNFILEYSEHSKYLYTLLGILQTLKIGTTHRNNFLKYIYSKDFLLIRSVENLVLALPFIIFLLYKRAFLMAGILLSLSVLLAIFNTTFKNKFTIPTPFFKKPFESIIGFRQTFFLFPIIYFITYQSITHHNFNLGVFCVFATFIITLFFYQKLEKVYYVWIFSLSPKQFLFKKVKTAIIQALVLVFPVVIALSISFPTKIVILLLTVLLSILYLISFVIAKYTRFPLQANITQSIILILCFNFPPALLIVIPYFYKQSVNRISTVLNDAP